MNEPHPDSPDRRPVPPAFARMDDDDTPQPCSAYGRAEESPVEREARFTVMTSWYYCG